jgi:hypothetical protein
MVPRSGDEYDRNGNVLLDDLFGARIHDLSSGVDSTRFAEERAGELRLAGHIAYVATLGGSSPVGSVGYAACALEIQAQSNDLNIDFAAVAGFVWKSWRISRLLARASPALAAANAAPLTSSGFVSIRGRHGCVLARDDVGRANLRKRDRDDGARSAFPPGR